jgi:hypothetical protein
MKSITAAITPLIISTLFLVSASPVKADAGVYFGSGQDLHQITSKAIHLASIDVTIVLGVGTVPATGDFAKFDKKETELIRGNLAE